MINENEVIDEVSTIIKLLTTINIDKASKVARILKQDNDSEQIWEISNEVIYDFYNKVSI